MSDDECVRFLQWALPKLGRRWAGYRKVRRQVCRRVRARCGELGLDGFAAYRAYLETEPAEWAVLDRLTQITISRFYRDREVFDTLRDAVLPALGAKRAWSAGCAGGEEPYTLALLRPDMRILATDIDETMLARARKACYTPSSLKELPNRDAFDDHLTLRPEYRANVTFARHDVRDPPPDGPFDLILCRYLAFTYFDDDAQGKVAQSFAQALRPGGALVIGTHEELPPTADFEPWTRCIFRRRGQPRPVAPTRPCPRASLPRCA